MKRLNGKFLLLTFVVIIVSLGGCSKTVENPVPAHDTFTIESAETNDTRTITVYTPPGYNENITTNYPVVYMPDGGILEDFPHIATTIDTAIRAGEMQPVILVGVENTERRRDMTPPTDVAKDREVAPVVGGSAAFRAFYAKELIPYINKNYRVTAESGIIGESLAALFIVELFLLQPELFDKYIALSPSLWWNNHEYVRRAEELMQAHPDMKVDLYLSSANEEDIYPHVTSLAKVLESHGPAGLRWEYEPRPDLRHNNIYRAISPQILRKFYPATAAAK